MYDLRNRVSDRESNQWWLDRLSPRMAFALGFVAVMLVLVLVVLFA